MSLGQRILLKKKKKKKKGKKREQIMSFDCSTDKEAAAIRDAIRQLIRQAIDI